MPDYIFMLESRLSSEQLEALNRVQQEAQEVGLNIYLVGGAVRDLMTGSPIRDLDFVAEGNPARLARRLATEGARSRETDAQRHGTELLLPDGVSLSLEMARSEFYRQPGRPPEVRPAPIMEDLRRRDFSINAMGISLTPGSRGLLLDPTNGLADIESRELRVLHNYSFVHDPIRLLRLVRFGVRLGFRPEARTQELFQAALDRGYEDYIEAEPLGQEAEQILREDNAAAVLKGLAEQGLLEVLHPLLQKRKPDLDGLAKLQKYRRQALEVGYWFDPFHAGLYYLRWRLKSRAQKKLLRNLGLKKAEVKQALGLEREARQVVKLLGRHRQAGPRRIYSLLTPIPVGLLVLVLAEYSSKKRIQSKIYNYLFKYRPLRKRLPVRELQLMGVPAGPKFDEILEKYFEALLDGRLRNRAQQLRCLRQLAGLPKTPPKPKARKKEEKPTPPLAEAAKAPAPAAAPAVPSVAKPAVKRPAAKPKPRPTRKAKPREKPKTKSKPKRKAGPKKKRKRR